MKNTFNDKAYSEAVEMAHLRFSVIAPAIQGLFSEPSKTAYYKRVAEKPLVLPDGTERFYNYNTFEKWEQYYKKRGMDGLMPRTRSDAGVTSQIEWAFFLTMFGVDSTMLRRPVSHCLSLDRIFLKLI